MSKIHVNTLKKIIREEIQKLSEGLDHDAAAKVASAASKLLNALENFSDSASELLKSETSENIQLLTSVLRRVIESPMQYVDVAEPAVKKVTLRPVKEKDVV